MKSLIALSLAWVTACSAFTARSANSHPLTRLGYEKENLHELLVEEWQEVHGPRFKREQASSAAAGAAAAAVVDETLAPRFPDMVTAKSSSVVEEPEFIGSHRGLAGPSKAGLVLAVAVTAGMAAASPEFDLSQFGSASELLQAGALAAGKITHDVQILATSSFADFKLADFDTEALQAAFAGMNSHLSDMQTHLMDQSQELMQASKDSIDLGVQVLQVAWADMMTQLNEFIAMLMAQLELARDSAAVIAQGMKTDLSEMITRLSAMQSNWMHDIEGYSEVLSAKIDCSLQEMQVGWTDMSSQFSVMQANWMQEFQKASQDVGANLNSATASLQYGLSETSARLSEAQTGLTRDVQEANQVMMTNLNAAKDSASVSFQGMQSDWSEMNGRFAEWQSEMTASKVEASKAFASTLADNMETSLSGISGYVSDLTGGWTQDISQGYQGFKEGASSLLTRVFVF